MSEANYEQLKAAVKRFFETECTCMIEELPEEAADPEYIRPTCPQSIEEGKLLDLYENFK